MIIESLIVDDGWLALDCCKAKLTRGSKIEIDNKHWLAKEIQNAFRMGLIALVGEIPTVYEEKPGEKEQMVVLRSNFTNRLAFDCVKSGVNPGDTIQIPKSQLDNREIINAMAAGWLVDVNGNQNPQAARGVPVELVELTTKDIVESPKAPKAGVPEVSILSAPRRIPEMSVLSARDPGQKKTEAAVPSRMEARPAPVAKSDIKAKPIKSAHKSEPDDAMFAPSKVINRPARHRNKAKMAPLPDAPDQDISSILRRPS